MIVLHISQGLAYYWDIIRVKAYRCQSFMRFLADNVFLDRMPTNEYEAEHLILARKMLRTCIFMIFYACSSLGFILIGPISAFVINHEYNIPSGVVLPFFDRNLLNTNLLNATAQSIFCIFAIAGLITVELMISIGNSTLCSLNHLAKFHLRNLNEHLNENQDYKYELREIVNMLEDIQNYAKEFNIIFYWKFLLQPVFTTYCVGIGIFCQYQVNLNTVNNRLEHFFHIVYERRIIDRPDMGMHCSL